MKKNLMLLLPLLIVFGFHSASAQFPIKIPKLPKIEKTKPEQPKSDGNSSSRQTNTSDAPQVQPKQNQSVQKEWTAQKLSPPRATNVPLLLIDTLDISLKQKNEYWKFPKQRYYSNWHPQVRFRIFYDNNERSRYTAEWFKPDGSLWFSESLDASETADSFGYPDGASLSSPYNTEAFDKLSTDQIGVHGLKITNNKTKEVLYQGKFNVKKSVDTPGDPEMKNAFQFFVDHDWLLAVGYAGFRKDAWGGYNLQPEVLLWFKGEPKREDLEARLFYNNQQILSTDDGGRIINRTERGAGCARGQEVCRFTLISFDWDRFLVNTQRYTQKDHPNTIFTNDKPGEYTIKVFYKGTQVREAKFTAAPDGMIARNSFSNNLYPSLTMIPVKAIGTAEKWNPHSWKTGMFYGNPIAGFTIQ